MPETSFLSTTTLEKQSNQLIRRQFTFDDKNSTSDREDRIGTLTFTAMLTFVLRDENASFSEKYDKMSIIHFLDVVYKEFRFGRTADSRRIARQLRTICRKNRVATTSLTQDIAAQSLRTLVRLLHCLTTEDAACFNLRAALYRLGT